MRGWLLILTLTGGCAAHQAPAVNPDAPKVFIIPFGAKGTDSVCVDTAPTVRSRPCLKLQELLDRLFSVDLPNGAKS